MRFECKQMEKEVIAPRCVCFICDSYHLQLVFVCQCDWSCWCCYCYCCYYYCDSPMHSMMRYNWNQTFEHHYCYDYGHFVSVTRRWYYFYGSTTNASIFVLLTTTKTTIATTRTTILNYLAIDSLTFCSAIDYKRIELFLLF